MNHRHKVHNISPSVPKGGTLDTKASRWAFCHFWHALHFPLVLKNYKALVWRGSSRFAQQLFLLHILETEKVAKTYTPQQEMENASSDETRTKGAAMLMFFGFVCFSPHRKGTGLTLKPMFAHCESFTGLVPLNFIHYFLLIHSKVLVDTYPILWVKST